jgi:hypothetical protein
MVGALPVLTICVLAGSTLLAIPLLLGSQVHGQDICATIAAKYAQNAGTLGAKTFPQDEDCALASNGFSLYALYENGNIYQINDPPAVMIVEGPIMDTWRSLGGEHGVLGFPMEDKKNALPSGNPGESQVFVHGILFKPNSNDVKMMMFGEIWDYYAQLGWEESQLGYPVSAQANGASPGSKYQQFENGYIYFTPSKGWYVTPDKDDSPSMVLPSITVDATDSTGAIVTYSVKVQDDYDPGVSASCNYPSGFLFSIGTTTVTCTVSDSINPPVVGHFTVTVKGDTDPLPPVPPAPPGTGGGEPAPPVPGTGVPKFSALVKGKLVGVDVTTSSAITNFILDEKAKRLSFRAEGESGTAGSTELSIGRILEGPYLVTVDGRVTTDFEVGNDPSGVATIKIFYTHSVHAITISGARVVPEFHAMIWIAIIPALVAVTVITRLGRGLRFSFP